MTISESETRNICVLLKEHIKVKHITNIGNSKILPYRHSLDRSVNKPFLSSICSITEIMNDNPLSAFWFLAKFVSDPDLQIVMHVCGVENE